MSDLGDANQHDYGVALRGNLWAVDLPSARLEIWRDPVEGRVWLEVWADDGERHIESDMPLPKFDETVAAFVEAQDQVCRGLEAYTPEPDEDVIRVEGTGKRAQLMAGKYAVTPMVSVPRLQDIWRRVFDKLPRSSLDVDKLRTLRDHLTNVLQRLDDNEPI